MRCAERANKVVPDGDAKRCLWLPEQRNAATTHLTAIPTYYLTLGGERAEKWFAKYKHFSSNLHIVDGVRGVERLAVEGMITQPYEAFSRIPAGVVGCTLSHMRAIKQAYDSGAEVALILEDDAVPDLAPWWPQSLEAYIASLPDDWQLSQLSWTTQEDRASQKYAASEEFQRQALNAVNGSKHFSPQAFWGTVAYLIHRRGMERVMSQLWQKDKGQFDVSQMAARCKYFTADDCLLSCSTWPELAHWLPGRELMLDKTYKAVPPMFTSYQDDHSLQKEDKQWVVKSYCDDIHSALHYSRTACMAV
jgi:GR25 family glycosyltransferase involved in LPS biosynthesis